MGVSTTFDSKGMEQKPPAAEPRVKSILIADADYRECAMIRNSLEGCGYEVSAWTRAEDARERLRHRPYDIVVTSTNLQKSMDDLVADLRPMKIPPKLILIADEDEGNPVGCCFLPTVVVVNRPFKVGEIADIVEHLIGPA